jgi:transposase-like protein
MKPTGKVTHRMREAYSLRVDQKKELADIAQRFGVTASTIKAWVARVKQETHPSGGPPPMTVEVLVQSIHKWVEKNASRESIFLEPNPHFLVDAEALLDHVYDVSGVKKPT